MYTYIYIYIYIYTQASYTHVVVYTRSSLVEQTTPVAVEISNTDSTVTAVGLVDQDLEPNELGGTVTWSEPGDTTHVDQYAVYLSESTAGAGRSQIGAFLDRPAEEADLPHTYIYIYRYIYISLSLSLCVCICIYVYMYIYISIYIYI